MKTQELSEIVLRAEDNTNSYSYYNNPTDTTEFTENDHKIGPISYHKRKELTGLKKGLAVSLALLSTLFLVSCGKHKKPYINQAPTFITETLPNAKENSLYSTFVQASDPQSDPVTYSIIGGTADGFLDINSSTGELNGTPSDIESGINHDLKVRATDDKSNFTEKTFLLYVINTANLSGKIVSALDLTPVQGAKVHIGTNEDTTDVNGNYSLADITDGEYDVSIDDGTGSETNFVTYIIGILPVTKTNESSNQLNNLDFALKPRPYNDFVYETILMGTGLRTEGSENFHNIIYTRDENGGADMPVAVVDAVKNYIKNQRSQVSFKTYTDADITVDNIDLCPAGQPADNTTYIYWDSSTSGGGAYSWVNGNNIIASRIRLSPNLGGSPNIESIILSEILRVLNNCTGDDSFNNLPHGYNDPANTTVLNQPDILNSILSYDPVYKRPLGNTDERTAGRYDVNPTGHLIRPR